MSRGILSYDWWRLWEGLRLSFWVSCPLGALGSRQFPLGLKSEAHMCLTGVLGIVPLEGQGEDKRQVTYLGCHSGEWRLDQKSLELAPPSLGAGTHTHLKPQSHDWRGPSYYTLLCLCTVSTLERWVLVENSTWAERGEPECSRSPT